ncbi:heavy metal efflux pump/ CzcA family protein [Synechococcus sp. BIOS-E4-1]|uniref:efflux RND transporter permease subunit n=1 Tax=Synechococcus sp. BIOS-E4-1 TaxID=1400864 RepID=UPI00164601B5|nr:efflux RND transporter permease subunit [Synechococcus sp. BIOS-E4-1]QNI54156.1 heavy metal efflux pump/ CzcA family protein [Synechococcus sp. BIOS-E4-1]
MFNNLLNNILRWSITRRWLVLISSLLISLLGVINVLQMPLDVFPPFAPPQVEIQTIAPGLAPEQVEHQISEPIEAAVNGLGGVDLVRSASKPGLSMVQVVFRDSASLERARTAVSERLQQVRMKLPESAEAPEISPLLSPLGTILQYAFTLPENASREQALQLRTLVQRTFEHPLLAIPGVAQVTIYGGDSPQTQLQLDLRALKDQDVSLNEVVEAAGNAQFNGRGGVQISGGQERLILSDHAISNDDDITRSVVRAGDGRAIPLGSIAEVRSGAAMRRGAASLNGQPAVVLMINKQPDVDTPQLTRTVEDSMRRLQMSLPADVSVTQTFRQAKFIEIAIRNVSESLLLGVVIVAVVLLLFLMNWRTALIALSAIPLSLLVGLLLMRGLGLQLNTMTLGGLVVAIGSVVDDAIVDMENCYRGLRSNRLQDKPLNPLDVVFRTSVEVRQPVLFSTLIIVVVFAPIFTLSGVEGRIFMPMGIAYVLSIVASTAVALTLSPALCALLLSRAPLPAAASWVESHVQAVYQPLLEFVLRSPRRVLVLAVSVVIATLLILPSLGRVFLPEFREQSLVNSMVLYPGVSLEMTSRAGRLLSQQLQSSDDVEWVQVRAGRAPGDADGAGVNIGHVDLELSDQAMRDRPAAIARIRAVFVDLPGVAPNVGGFISHRMDEVLSGVRSAIAIKIAGPDLLELRDLGEQVRDAVGEVSGVVDLQLEPQLPVPQVQLRIDREAALRDGVSVAALARAAEVALHGTTVGQAPSSGVSSAPLVVTLPAEQQGDLQSLSELPIRTASGALKPLGDFMTFEQTTGPNEVNREDVSRRIVVSANVAGRPLGPVVNDIRRRVEQSVKLPPGYTLRYGGQFESEQRATRSLVLYSLLAAGVIAAVMVVAVRSLPATVAILLNLPLALVGGLVAVLLSGSVLSVASLIGFITLFGVAVRNGLLLVDNYNRRHQRGESLKALIRAGTLDRLNAILMTALTSSLGMLPLALAFGAGNEILQPLAIVVLGGLITSTLLTLVVIPALYARFGSRLLADATL